MSSLLNNNVSGRINIQHHHHVTSIRSFILFIADAVCHHTCSELKQVANDTLAHTCVTT